MTRSEAYRILQLKPGAQEPEIRRQFKRMALKVHPDINPDPQANEQFIRLTKAMELLLAPPEKPHYPHRHYSPKSGESMSPEELEKERKRRMETARQRFEEQKARREYEDNSYFRLLTTGRRWAVFSWIVRTGWFLAIVLSLDAFLPYHEEKDTLIGYSVNEHNGILYEKISAVELKKNGMYYMENKPGYWMGSYPEVLVSKTWLLHTPVRMYVTDDLHIRETGFDFHLGAVRWLAVILLLVPLLTYFRKRKDLIFVFLYQFSFWGIGGGMIYLLLTENRLTHLLSLGFL